MSNAIISFAFEKQTVRTAIDQEHNIWFCLPDVASILEISNANPSRFNLDEEGVHKMYTPTNGGVQQLTFINEPNLYRVIFRSNKKEAVKFQNWVFDEVLPTIRKTGSYHIPQPTPKPTSPTLSPTDWATIRRAVLIIANGMYYKQQAINAIYGRLRNLCGVDSVTQIRYEHLPLIQSELYRIERTLSVYQNQRRQIEQKLIRRVCLDDANIIAESVVEIERTAHAYAQKFDEAASAISTARYITKCVEGNGDA